VLMGPLLAFALLVLSVCATIAQEPAAGRPALSTPPKGENSGPPVGGAAIPSELRSNAAKDVPMGNGKPKANVPAAGQRNEQGRK
jgi:hypothetical protein